MAAPENTFRTRLLAGETLVGCWLTSGTAYMAEVAMTAGYDWFVVDGEHSPNDLSTLSAQMGVLLRGAAEPLIRPPHDHPAVIKQMLDIGARSLLVPMVESGAQAEAIVRATRYPPAGIRGVGATAARASGFGSIPDYIGTANDGICVVVQVETPKGHAALDEILAVDGVDGVFIGPADLAANMGHGARQDAPEVTEAIADILTRARAAGKGAGFLSLNDSALQAAQAAGCTMLGVDIDVMRYALAMRARRAQFRG